MFGAFAWVLPDRGPVLVGFGGAGEPASGGPQPHPEPGAVEDGGDEGLRVASTRRHVL